MTPLVLVRRIELWTVPVGIEPSRVVRTTCEPLVMDRMYDRCGVPWVATGERNERGQLVYRHTCDLVAK
jgi:hypothetical protein